MKVRMLSAFRLSQFLIFWLFSFQAFAQSRFVEVHSPNFIVLTDAGESRGREVAIHFEQMREVFAQLFHRARLQTGVPLRIFAFRNRKGLEQVAPLWKGKPEKLGGLFAIGPGAAYIALDLTDRGHWSDVYQSMHTFC